MTLADEVLTSDSSRYWDAAAWASGTTPRGAHGELRQADRARLARRELGRDGEPPALPDEIVEQTAARYRELLERLTDRPDSGALRGMSERMPRVVHSYE